MECFLKVVLEVLSQIAAPCIRAFREGSEKARNLQARAETAEKRSLELEHKNHVYESQIQTLREKLSTAQAKLCLASAALLWSMIFPRTRVLVGLVVLGIVCSSRVVRLAENVRLYGSQHIPQAIAYLVERVERIRSRMLDWRWKSAPVSRMFRTTQ